MYVLIVTLLAGLGTTAAGVWSLAAPASFADFVEFGNHEHFLHDIGAFQIGIGVTLLLACVWTDALLTALAGFVVADGLHAVVHFADADLGGRPWQAWLIAAAAVLAAVAFGVRLRRLGYVVGGVGQSTVVALAPFVRQKTVRLTTFRRDGRSGGTPVSIAVDGDHAYVRSFERSVKTRRLRHDPTVEFAPSTALGRPTGPTVRARARRLSGVEDRRASRLLARKHPLLHGVLVPLAHRVILRRKTGRTVHFELTPLEP